jgi:biotin carboxyl carrier protein
VVPGELLSYSVEVGAVLKAGEPLCVLESMKMEMKISVPDELDGKVVKSLPCSVRTKEKQGDLLMPGDLLMEVEDAK